MPNIKHCISCPYMKKYFIDEKIRLKCETPFSLDEWESRDDNLILETKQCDNKIFIPLDTLMNENFIIPNDCPFYLEFLLENQK